MFSMIIVRTVISDTRPAISAFALPTARYAPSRAFTGVEFYIYLMKMEAAILIKDVHRSFKQHFWHKKKHVLKGISLTINKGEVFGFLGPNGAGKTTTIKIITGLLRPDSGQVSIQGLSTGSREAKRLYGFLPEAPYFYDHLTAFEFMKIHALLSDLRKPRHQVKELLARVGLSDVMHVVLRRFSRGMLQRLGIAQALINDPDILILDEPLTGLDPIGRKDMKDIILEQKSKGKTVFFSSHILPDAEAVCDRIAILIDGVVEQIGVLRDLLKKGTRTDEITLEEWFMKQVAGKPKSS